MQVRATIIFALLPSFVLAMLCDKQMYDPKTKGMITGKVCCNGYRAIRNNKSNTLCEPICHKPCGHGVCDKPNTCTCDPGYTNPNQLRSRPCVPFCSKGCKNGQCVAPEECLCNTGHQLDESGGNCVPVCPNGCQNGFCESPGKCTCPEGYSLDSDQSCSPVCTEGCAEDQMCVAPNTCSCREGFCPSTTSTESNENSSTSTMRPEIPVCLFGDIVRFKCSTNILEHWKIPALVALVGLLAMIMVGCLIKLKTRRGIYWMSQRSNKRIRLHLRNKQGEEEMLNKNQQSDDK